MYALRGKREYQEDCGAVVELGDLLVLAVADGYSKPGERGLDVSKSVVAELLARLGADLPLLVHDPQAFIRDTFDRIHEATRHYLAGSTLSLVVIDRSAQVATLGYIGDSIIILTDAAGDLHVHPMHQLRARKHGLLSAFGDSVHAASRTAKPSIVRHTLGPDSILIVSSDGLYPVTPEDDLGRFTALAHRYIAMIRSGGTPQSLANYALENEQSPDNVTVAVYQAERVSITV